MLNESQIGKVAFQALLAFGTILKAKGWDTEKDGEWPTTWEAFSLQLKSGWLAGVTLVDPWLFSDRFSDEELAEQFFWNGYCQTLNFPKSVGKWSDDEQKANFIELIRRLREIVRLEKKDAHEHAE